MQAREIPGFDIANETKSKIMERALESFAQKGFAAVSMRDIAKAVGINIASIYYHYESKEAIFEDILEFFERGYRHYFEWLSENNMKASSLEEVMDNMFNDEFVYMLNPVSCLGMSLAIKEQHQSESACRCVFELFFEYSIEHLKADFDRLIENGVLPPSDTKTIATLFMFCVMVSNDIRVHEYYGNEPPLSSAAIYEGLKKHLTQALAMGY